MHDFDRDYWQRHWQPTPEQPRAHQVPPNPYVAEIAQQRTPGHALDAGCGTGTESLLLAAEGWQVTGADISAHALDTARIRAAEAGLEDSVTWVEADLTSWEPARAHDLVFTCYAHPSTSHAEFYARLAGWVRPGGMLLLVGHVHTHDHTDHAIPEQAQVTLAEMAGTLGAGWRIDAANQHSRQVPTPAGEKTLHDVVLRATRRS